MINLKQIYRILALPLLGFVACMPADLNEQWADAEKAGVRSVEVVARNFVSAETSRTSVEVESKGAIFSWAENDTIGIFPNTGYQIAFPMTSGAGSQSAVFDGGGWALNVESSYAAYYPFGYNHTNQEKLEVTYWGQSQKGNGDTRHLSAFDYMVAAPVTPNANKVTFDFHHVGALLQWRLKLPETVKLTSFSMQSDEAVFVGKGMLNLKSGTLVADTACHVTELSMGLNEVSTIGAGLEVVIYMMVAPMDLTGHSYRLKVTNEFGACATAEVEGKNFEAGKIYALSADFSSFEATTVSVNKKIGKVISSEGGDITLETEGDICQYIITDEAKGWIQLLSESSSSDTGYTFQVSKNESENNRRGFVVFRNLVTGEAVEYAVLQGGVDSYAITEPNDRMPLGVLTSNSRTVSEEHGLSALVDCNLETYYEADTVADLHISWEGPYAIPIQSVEYGCDAGECGLQGMTFHVATDGTDWDGLGWSWGYGYSDITRLGVNVVQCRSRFYRLIVTSNQGGATTRVSEFGVTVDNDREKKIETLNDVFFYGHDFTEHYSTPMGNFCADFPATTDDEAQWLGNPNVEADALGAFSYCQLTECEVNLYPNGTPSPSDIFCRNVYRSSIGAVLADMAYLYPSFIRSIISSYGNGIYTVKMYDPKGKQITIAVKSQFYCNGSEIFGVSGRDSKANWATIMEKAIIKWNHIYRVASDYYDIRPEYVMPMFTGDGASFKVEANIFNAEQLSQAVNVAMKNGLAVVATFTKDNLEIDGVTPESWRYYSVMFSNRADALFAVRNPMGHHNDSETDDGVLHIVNNDVVPRTIELYFMYPGAASKYSGALKPYEAPSY